jgi:hypothetical protein
MRISPGALSALVGGCGTGLAVAFPDARLVGIVIIVIAVAVFAFEVAVENGGLRARPNRTHIIIGIFMLCVLGFAGWYFWPFKKTISEAPQLREQLEKVEKLGPLFEYFEKDTVGDVAIQSVLVVTLSSSASSATNSIYVPFILFFAPDSNAYVASIYFPRVSDSVCLS